jgi:hypothetical protein
MHLDEAGIVDQDQAVLGVGQDAAEPWRPIHYLGSKLRVLETLEGTVSSVSRKGDRVCDLFSGSGTVSAWLARSRAVSAIDIQEYSRVICSALLKPGRVCVDALEKELDGALTPSKTIESIVREKMDALDLERDVGNHPTELPESGSETTVFERAPGLSFTRILAASLNSEALEKPNWAGLLLEIIKHVKEKGITSDRLPNELQVPAKSDAYEEEGFRFYPEIGISIQGQSAPDAWKEVSRLANKHRIPVEVEFQWRDNEKAQYPGRIGIVRAGV